MFYFVYFYEKLGATIGKCEVFLISILKLNYMKLINATLPRFLYEFIHKR